MSHEDALSLALDGTVVVEGAAGTGKTGLVVDMVLRILVESERLATEIGVLTALPGAAEALQSNLRNRLEGLIADGLAHDSQDPLARRWAARYQDRGALRARLEALRLDCPALRVMTFGIFCTWLLEECGWSAGAMPGVWENIGWERSFTARVAEQWRADSIHLSPLQAEFLLQQGVNHLTLTREIQPYVGRGLRLLTPRVEDLAAKEADYQAAYLAFQGHWRAGGRSLLSRFWQRSDPSRSGRQAFQQRLGSVDRWLEGEQASLGDRLPVLEPPANLLGDPTAHPVFAAWTTLLAAREDLLGELQRWLAWYRGDLLGRCEELGRERRARGALYSVEDRVLLLAEHLRGPRGERLAGSIRRRLPALVWDDCQQGGRAQHEIVQRIYAGTGLPVVLLGDPCQSNDRFRRADVFAYLEQRRRAQAVVQLDTAYRAVPALGQVVALIFNRVPQPFAMELGGARPAVDHQGQVAGLSVEGDQEPPFRFWWLADDEGRSWSAEEAGERAALACAGEIARLLNLASQGEAQLGDRSLNANDIVVLVETHAQGRRMYGALLRMGVPGVRLAPEDVLQSREAEELERVLLAAAEPWREDRVLVALTTDLMGLDGRRLLSLVEDISLRQEYLDAFRSYHELWRRHGFMRMFRSWLAEESVQRRLLQFRDGERRLTNLFHLSELLQATALRAGLGPEALCRWMRNRRFTQDSDEGSRLRLASDEPRVRVITGHLAQGQSYPVVFCPFAWEVTDPPGVAALCHDPDDELQPVVDFGSSRLDQHRRLAAQESLSLRLRFLYLMLTRASAQLYLMWGKIRGQGASGAAWLLHQPPAGLTDPQSWADHVEGLSAEQLLGDLSQLVNAAQGALRIEYAPEEVISYTPPETEESEPSFRYFPGPVRGRWQRWRWRDLGPRVGRPGGVALVPESVSVALMTPVARQCWTPEAFLHYLQQRGWGCERATALLPALWSLLHRPRIAGKPLAELLSWAQADVPVCLSLARLAQDGATPPGDDVPTVGFLEDQLDWLIALEGRFHAVFCCWESWSAQTPALLGLPTWAGLAGRALDAYLRQRLVNYHPVHQLGAVHFLFPKAMDSDDPMAGYWWAPALPTGEETP